MKIPERYRKWLTVKAWFNCFRLTVALFIFVWLYQSAQDVVFTNINPIWMKSIFLAIMALFFSFVIWLLALLSPEAMETLFAMLGSKNEEKKDETKPKNEVS